MVAPEPTNFPAATDRPRPAWSQSRTWLGVACLLALLVSGALLLRPHMRKSADRLNVTHCASNALQLRSRIGRFLDRGGVFPDLEDSRAAFASVSSSGDEPTWLQLPSSACPEASARDGSLGYVFVAQGLSTALVRKKRALIFFCPGLSHRGTEQHAHALRGGELDCLKDNAAMVELLRDELARAESGEVPYAPVAVALLRRELALRLAPVPGGWLD